MQYLPFHVILFLVASVHLYCFQPSALLQDGAINVSLPAYNSDGRIHWELHASKVDPIATNEYRATNPSLCILQDNKPETIAKSSEGFFNLQKHLAHGESTLSVYGRGFEAAGNAWTFEGSNIAGGTRLSCSNDAKVAFEYELNHHLASNPVNVSKKYSKSQITPKSFSSPYPKDAASDFPTVAWAKKFDLFDQGLGNYKFILVGDVLIKMTAREGNQTQAEKTSISCHRLVINLNNEDGNTTKGKFGVIEKLYAQGSVILKQPARICRSEELFWNHDNGEILLEGNASVMDSQWGKAEGEKIILRKEDGRAEVVGGESGRSKLSISDLVLPPINFPKVGTSN